MATIELSDDHAAALRAKAAAHGLSLEAWRQELAKEDPTANQNAGRKGRYSLSELMQKCDLNFPLSAEDRAWLNAAAIGREVL